MSGTAIALLLTLTAATAARATALPMRTQQSLPLCAGSAALVRAVSSAPTGYKKHFFRTAHCPLTRCSGAPPLALLALGSPLRSAALPAARAFAAVRGGDVAWLEARNGTQVRGRPTAFFFRS